MASEKLKGIIFDMDNTILRSRIDFQRMKRSVYEYLESSGVLPATVPLDEFTSSTLIELARSSPRFTAQVQNKVWDIVTGLETEGMNDAGLEPGVIDLLERLQSRCRFTVLTNNARGAAVQALRRTGIEHYFDLIIGREQAALKPSPAGAHHIVGRYPEISTPDWLSVGDAWIDGKCAMDAGIRFVAYQANRAEMERRGVRPVAYIDAIADLEKYISFE